MPGISVASNQSPADGASVSSSEQAVSVTWTCTASWAIREIVIYWRRNGGVWRTGQSWVYNHIDGFVTSIKSYTITGLAEGDRVDWYSTCKASFDDLTTYIVTDTMSTYYFTIPGPGSDTTAPNIGSPTPAASASIPPTDVNGVTFYASVTDSFGVNRIELWVDAAEVVAARWTGSGQTLKVFNYQHQLTKGAHTWYLKATDVNGNVETMPSRNLTVTNATPVIDDYPEVAGDTFGNGAAVEVTWTAATDDNYEDTLTYTLEEQYDGGGYVQYATGLTGTSTAWVPSQTGTANLRMLANDGTADSAYKQVLGRTGPGSTTSNLTITSTQAPNAPTLDTPAGAESWREGEVHAIEWTPASPEDPDGDDVTYEGQFSADGTFGDAVEIFSGQTGGSYSWTLAVTLVGADTATCKVRVRARDEYDMVSAWVPSLAFTVTENAAPTITLISPADAAVVTDTTPAIEYLVEDADGDALHVELELSLSADYSIGTIARDSEDVQDEWEDSPSPFTVWSAFDAGGTTSGYHVRWTSTDILRYDTWYVRARAFDGILYSDWVESTIVVAPADGTLVVTVDSTEWQIENLVIVDVTGGEIGSIDFRIPTQLYDTAGNPPTVNDAVSVAANLSGTARTWNGTVEEVTPAGAWTAIHCVQDDAYLSRKVCASVTPLASQDVGQSIVDLVGSYGAPLTATAVDVTTGYEAAVNPGYKNIREHLDDWAKATGYISWVDSSGDLHFVDPADLAVPEYVLVEG